MNYYLGLDVGGTYLAAAVVTEDCRIYSKCVLPSGAGRCIEDIIADMARVSEMAVEKSGLDRTDISSWGIGIPGNINAKTNRVVRADCFGWKNINMFPYLEKYSGLPIYMANDGDCAVLGELMAGNAKGYKNVIMLTLGTGVGGGIILDGKLYSGTDGMGAEFGHMKLVYNGLPCSCGQKGCAEAYCSATGLIMQAREELMKGGDSRMYELCHNDLSQLDAKMVVEAVSLKDGMAEKVFGQYTDYLTAALSGLVAIFRPEIILLGGGVANAGEILRVLIQEKLAEFTYAGTEIGIPEIKMAKCGNDAGILGAALLEKHKGMFKHKINNQ